VAKGKAVKIEKIIVLNETTGIVLRTLY
jgi:hypothetical protein